MNPPDRLDCQPSPAYVYRCPDCGLWDGFDEPQKFVVHDCETGNGIVWNAPMHLIPRGRRGVERNPYRHDHNPLNADFHGGICPACEWAEDNP